MNECKIVAVLNRKGGVCKTTTTHNLGVALVQRGYRVLLVDCDTQRNLSISLGLNRPDEELSYSGEYPVFPRRNRRSL